MYKTISNKIIREFNPCYDPSKFITDENEELLVKDWVRKYRNVVPAKDIVWLLLSEEFLSEKDLRLFAVWCAREALKLIENPDHRSIEACDVAERYANGEATEEELLAARHGAAYAAVNDAARAAYYAARTTSETSIAAYAAAYEAARATYYAARVTSEAAYDAIRSVQLDKLLTYFE
jgi:hypothetical protein